MITFKSKFLIIGSIVACFLIQAQGADKYTDENRPYEFGFSIDGEQHRHEKKDENGLIMGEFGFITADGVYHVTVYATDEQGRFKILSMKNIRVKPYPTYTGKQSISTSNTSERQGHSLDLTAAPQAPSFAPPSTTEISRTISLEPPGRSCSSCSIPTTSTAAPILPQVNQASNIPNQIGPANPGFSPQSSFASPQNQNNVPPQQSNGLSPQFGNAIPQAPSPSNNPTSQQTFENGNQAPNVPSNNPISQQAFGNGNQAPNTPLGRDLLPPLESSNSNPTQPQNSFAPQIPLEQGQQSGPGSSPSAGIPEGPTSAYSPQAGTPIEQPGFPAQPQIPANDVQGAPRSSQYPEDSQSPQNVAGARSPKRLDEPALGLPPPNSILRGSPNPSGFDQEAPAAPNKPTLISAQMQIVDKNTDIHHLNPGEKEGLPKGLTKDDMSQLLYTFNYTVGFHGHFEEGYTSGVKQGYYFVTGRNGVRTRIDYTADSEGFHPKISQEVLDLLSDDVPKPETEKEEKYGLKGYEFKWMYYPVEDRAS